MTHLARGKRVNPGGRTRVGLNAWDDGEVKSRGSQENEGLATVIPLTSGTRIGKKEG